ncbi:MAG: hypothetical protein V7L01_27055 [Nostoc sp.]|uniref:hypothetical protein n=1 Tax=Nostoc sp. TaxID=1180 RepID=UPI002FFCFEA5
MSEKITQIFKLIEDTITNPPIPHEPYKQSLKAWAMYCLRYKGFIVVYAQNADFAIETKGAEKLYFKVSNSPDDLDDSINWIVWDNGTKTASVIPKK